MYPRQGKSGTETGCVKAGVGRVGGRRTVFAGGLAALAVAVFASTATAAGPLFLETWQDLGGRLRGWHFYIDWAGVFEGPFWAELTYYGYDRDVHYSTFGPGIPGQIQNIVSPIKATIPPEYDGNVYCEADADPWAEIDPAYTKILDSWVCEEFCYEVRAVAGGTPTDNYFYVDSSTGPGVFPEGIAHAYIVCDGDIVIQGRMGHDDVSYEVGLATFRGCAIVDPGGPYQVGPGQEITLDGSGSAACEPIDSWLWDLDNDRAFDDASGEQVTVSYDYLVNGLGLGLGEHTIGLRVIAGGGIEAQESSTLHIIPEPATLALLALGALVFARRRR